MTKYILTFLIAVCLMVTAGPLLAQKATVHIEGKVLNKELSLPQVKVDILGQGGSPRYGETEADGSFSIDVPKGKTIEFRYVGMKTLTKAFTIDAKDVVLYLEAKPGQMQEVMVTGFKKVTRETMTGSSVLISGDQLQDVPVTNVTELLQGKIAGLDVQVNSGMPGARNSIHLRGTSSAGVTGAGANAFMTPTSPLFVVDGVQIDDNANYEYGFDQAGPGISPLSAIPPEDVESVEVLKDAQATALYGSRGAYGVILITTKRGQSSVPIVRYTGSYFVNTVPKLRDVIGGKDERYLRIQQILQYDSTNEAALALINNTYFLSDSLSPYYNNATNWQKVFYKNTSNQSHNVNISGGSQKFNYKANLGYYNEKGIVENTGLDRYTLNMNALYQPSTRFRMQITMNSSMVENQKGSGVGLVQQGVAKGSGASSLLPSPSQYSANNAALESILVRDNNKTGTVMSNLDIRWEIFPKIRLSSNESYTVTSAVSDNFRPAFVNSGLGEASSFNSRAYNLYSRNMISYDNSFNDETHNINFYAFNEITKNTYRANNLMTMGTANDDIEGPYGNNAYQSYNGTSSYTDYRGLAYGASFSYNYMKKYMLDLSIRTDGTSTNGPNSGWTKNPTVGLRWNFYKENWMKGISWLDYGSFRFSWGKNIIPTGTIFDVYGKYSQGDGYNNENSIVNSWGSIPNPNFLPQTTSMFNWGTEAGFLQGRIDFVYEFYYKTVTNQISVQNIADINGFGSLSSNDLANADWGHELTLSFRPLNPKSPVKWTLSTNASYVKDILTQLPNGQRQLIGEVGDDNLPVLQRLGRNVFTNLLFNTKGVYATDADVPINPADGKPMRVVKNGVVTFFQAGDPIWADLNGDYIIDDNDRVAVGNPRPLITGGITNFLQYKNFSLNINMSFTLLRDIINTSVAEKFDYFADPTEMNVLVPIAEYDFWQKPGDNSKYPNPFNFIHYDAIDPFRVNQTMYMEDGSYVKINNITLGYNLNRDWTKKWGVTSCRLYLTAANVATFSHYSGPNPENVTDLGYDNSNGYPNRRNFTFGLNVQF